MCFWITLLFLLVFLIASIPVYPYSRTWGYYPASGIIALLILLLLLWWLAWLPVWYYPAPVEPVTPIPEVAPVA